MLKRKSNKNLSNGLKILIIGFGSIGQRHYRNLLELGFKNIFIYNLHRIKLKGKNFKVIKNLDRYNLTKFDVIFICVPNNLHIKTALACARSGCHLFIEKPLSHNMNGINTLQRICQHKKLIVMIACNMRFHPCLQFIKKYLDKNKLGKVYSISHEFGYYLPYWRQRADYKKNYAARKETGGGIILDDIHEFDLLFWFNNFVKIKEVNFVYDKISDLEIATEDNCMAVFKFSNKVLGLVKCDYLQKKYTRSCKIVGEKGNLEWDFNENIVWLHSNSGSKKLFVLNKYDFNNMYIDEVKYFFDCVNKKKKTFNDIKIAADVLKYCIVK